MRALNSLAPENHYFGLNKEQTYKEFPRIIIKTEKTSDVNGRRRKIISIEGVLDAEQLPCEYFNGNPRIFLYEGGIHFGSDSSRARLSVGFEQSEESFREDLRYIKKAGYRLSKINKRIRENLKDWGGEETFVI